MFVASTALHYVSEAPFALMLTFERVFSRDVGGSHG